jgi:UDP-N-acetylmuramate dehydrogenase
MIRNARTDVPLAPETTLEVGGSARYLVEAFGTDEVVDAVADARASGLPLLVLGGGSNLLVSDTGFDGVVLRSSDFHIDMARDGDDVLISVGAGVEWDEFVEFCVAEGFAGLECLSGIPGRVGAAPVQNIGAYGAEIGARVEFVNAVDAVATIAKIDAAGCEFGYRDSVFKRSRRGDVVTAVTFRLRVGGEPEVRYDELRRRLEIRDGGPLPSLAMVRDAVLAIRRAKSMLWEEGDDNRRSAGSFFVNPVVDAAVAAAIAERYVSSSSPLPAWAQPDGRTKLSAGWLIERAGFEKGYTFGQVGLSSRHALALVNRGRARAADVVALAGLIRRGVRREFGVTLAPEAVFVGFSQSVDELLG